LRQLLMVFYGIARGFISISQGRIGDALASCWCAQEKWPSDKAAFTVAPDVPPRMAEGEKKRFPVSAKTLMVTPLCCQQSKFIYQCQRLGGMSLLWRAV
jgi:hypothetical protein